VAQLGPNNVEMAVYMLAGLSIVSDFPLKGLPLGRHSAAAQHEVVIRRAPVPEALPSVAANGKEVLLDYPKTGRFLVRNGNEILIEPAPLSDEGEILVYLLGTAFGVLCHQRGIPPLHASAIDVADGCVAFVGETGAGKSTLVAALAARGHQVIADDVCFLQLGDNGVVQAWPGVSRIRLWEDAMATLGCDGPGVERETRRYNKYLIPLRPAPNSVKPRRLRRVYALHATPDGGATNLAQIRGVAALEVLMQNVYRLGFAERMGHKPTAFALCAAVARDVPVFRFSRPLGFGVLDEGVEFLQDHLRDLT
jgi:hypothetical protein